MLATDAIPETVETAAMLQRMRQIGRRTAEMHQAFACNGEPPAFAPEPITQQDIARWADTGLARARLVFAMLERGVRELSDAALQCAQRLLERRDEHRGLYRELRGSAPKRSRSAITATSISVRC